MKKVLWLIVCLMTMVFVSCETKEEKCQKLIKEELFKTLCDFDSYEPIETKVIEAKASIYNDTSIWNRGEHLRDSILLCRSNIEDINYNLDMANIYAPASYFSSYSYGKAKEYHKKSGTLIKRNKVLLNNSLYLANEILLDSKKIDTTKVVGYDVSHSFRCKSKDGVSCIAHFRYLISKDFKKILIIERTDIGGLESTRCVLDNLEKFIEGNSGDVKDLNRMMSKVGL